MSTGEMTQVPVYDATTGHTLESVLGLSMQEPVDCDRRHRILRHVFESYWQLELLHDDDASGAGFVAPSFYPNDISGCADALTTLAFLHGHERTSHAPESEDLRPPIEQLFDPENRRDQRNFHAGQPRDGEALDRLVHLWRCNQLEHGECWTTSHLSTREVGLDAAHCDKTCACWQHSILRYAIITRLLPDSAVRLAHEAKRQAVRDQRAAEVARSEDFWHELGVSTEIPSS